MSEYDLIKPTNKTRHDAFVRLSQARTGSLVDASDDYLEGLREYLTQWRDRVEHEIFRRNGFGGERERRERERREVTNLASKDNSKREVL